MGAGAAPRHGGDTLLGDLYNLVDLGAFFNFMGRGYGREGERASDADSDASLSTHT